MKILGLIGGISWVSTIDYYKYINEGVNQQLGDNEFARCMIYSLNFGDVIRNSESGHFESNYDMVLEAGLKLKHSGAEAIVICANTMNMFAERLEMDSGLKVIHIAEATARAVDHTKLKKVGLLGTRPTMELYFYKEKFVKYGIEVITPDLPQRVYIHDKIFSELGKGLKIKETKKEMLAIMDSLVSRGADGIVLGCTEIPMIISQKDVNVPVFNTTRIHSEAAVNFVLSGNLT